MDQQTSSENKNQLPAYCLTDVGLKRTSNEDAFWINPFVNLYVVVDGMGGHNAGEIASKMAIELLKQKLNEESLRNTDNDLSRIERLLYLAMIETSAKIFNYGRENQEWSGMGCTAAVVWINENKLFSIHAGDARIYVCNKKEICQIGNDHSHVAEVVKLGKMTKEEARLSPLKNQITQALGMSGQLEPEFHMTNLLSGDRILLCSDGLWDMLPDHEIHQIILSDNNPKSICEELIINANNAGGYDNITALVSIH